MTNKLWQFLFSANSKNLFLKTLYAILALLKTLILNRLKYLWQTHISNCDSALIKIYPHFQLCEMTSNIF